MPFWVREKNSLFYEEKRIYGSTASLIQWDCMRKVEPFLSGALAQLLFFSFYI
jgi:hypothetical protein